MNTIIILIDRSHRNFYIKDPENEDTMHYNIQNIKNLLCRSMCLPKKSKAEFILVILATLLVSNSQQTIATTTDLLEFNTTGVLESGTIENKTNNAYSNSSYQKLSLNNSTGALISNNTLPSISDFPKASNDVDITSNEDRQLNVSILENDFDIDGDKLTIISVTKPINGTTDIHQNNNTLSYKPDPNFYGINTFNYKISDGHNGTDTGLVTVNVSSVNDIPIANNDTLVTMEDLIPRPIDVLANDMDVDREDILTQTLVTLPRNGSASVNKNNGTIYFRPDPNFNGINTFNYKISDGHNGTDTGLVTVNVSSVNDIPIANNDSKITNEDIPIRNFDVLSNDEDVDVGDFLRIIGVTQPRNGTSSYSNNTISYEPSNNFNGNVSFTYVIADNKNSTDKGTINVQVMPDNDPPTAINDTIDTFEDFPLDINVLQNDNDIDSNKTSLYLGNITKSNTTKGNVRTNMDHTITYTPSFAGLGKDLFRYTVFDEYGANDTGTVTVTIKSALEEIRNFLHKQFSVSPHTRTFLTINMYPYLLQGDPKTDLNIKGILAHLSNGSGIRNQPINIEIKKNNQTQVDGFFIMDLMYDIIKRPDVSAQEDFNEEAKTDGDGNYEFNEPLRLGHGNYTVVTYPRNATYDDLKVSTSFIVERPSLPLSDIVSSLIPILTLTGIGVAALKVLPKHMTKKKQNETALLYMDKIDSTMTKIEAKDLEKEITDLELKNKITKEQFEMLNKKITDVLQKLK